MKKISYAEFLEDWENELIYDVQATANHLYGKSVKGQAENPKGFIMVFCIEGRPIDTTQPSWWDKFKSFVTTTS